MKFKKLKINLTKAFKNLKGSIWHNNWVVTLTATLIGVFLALYLNEKVSAKNRDAQKSVAIENIISEINENNKKLKKTVKKLKTILSIHEFTNAYRDDEKRLIVSSDSMSRFRREHPGILTVLDSVLISGQNYHYKGELDVEFNVSNIEVTSVAWQTLKNSGLSSTFGFDCLLLLEMMDNSRKEMLVHERILLDHFSGAQEFDTNEKLIEHLKLLIGYNEAIISNYESTRENLKNCK